MSESSQPAQVGSNEGLGGVELSGELRAQTWLAWPMRALRPFVRP